jgi:multiple sugar transport system permease protein
MTRRLPAAWWLLLPALTLITVFFLVPVGAAFLLSLTDFDVYGIAHRDTVRVVGLANYERLLADPRFWTALRNTLVFVLVGGPLAIAVSLGAALAVNARVVRWPAVFRTMLFVPVVTTLVAVAIVWRFLYHPRTGLVAELLTSIGLPPIDWLGDPRWAMPAIILLSIWKSFGFNMLIFVAGLQSIPERLYEAARLDGAGAWQRLRYVTLPSLAPTTGFVVVTTTIGGLQLFAEPYVMTQGGPGDSTLSIVLLMYEEGFRWWNLGYAAAIAFVLFAIIVAVTGAEVGVRKLVARGRPA